MSPKLEKLSWGFIACGKITNDFANALKFAVNNHKVIAISTSNSIERAREFHKKLGYDSTTKTYGSYNELLANPNVDIVYIAVLNNSHVEWTLKALDAGKHVLCEKPIGLNDREVKKIVEKAHEKKLFVMEALWSTCFPIWKQIRETIHSGELGKVLIASCNFGVKLPPQRLSVAEGETPILDIGVYSVAFVLHAFGFKKPKSIHIVGNKNQNGSDTWGNITLDFGDGTYGLSSFNGVTELPNSAYVTFEKGQLLIPNKFWCPTEIIKIKGNFNDSTQSKQKIKLPLPDQGNDKAFVFCNSSGLHYEADHVFERICDGYQESNFITLENSVTLHEVLTEARRQLGVVYPQD